MANPFPEGDNDAPLGQQRLYRKEDDGSYTEVDVSNPYPIGIFGTSALQKRLDLDSFGRLKVAEPTTLFDEKMTYRIPELFDQLTANGATIAHDADLSGALLSVAAQADSRAVLQMAQYAQYQPGNAHEINITYGNITLNGSCELRVGYFDDENGIFISYKDGAVSLTLRTSISGSVSDANTVAQASWNIDPLDGTGPSGITLDLTGRQIFSPDLEWLSVGTVQVGFLIDREFVPVHAFNHTNTAGAAYMTTADLPCRWELLGDGANTSSVVAQCCSVKSSGGAETVTGFPFTVESPWVTGIPQGSEQFLLAIRPKATFGGKDNHVGYRFLDYPVVAGSEALIARVLYNPTVTGGSWDSVNGTSATEVNTTASSISGGTPINSVPLPTTGLFAPRGGQIQRLISKLPFTRHIDGSVDVIAIVAEAIDGAGTGEAKASLNFVEQQ